MALKDESASESIQPQSLEQIRCALKDHCLERVSNLYNDVYNHVIYINTGLEILFKSDLESDKQSITLLGPPGTGKSTLLCRLALEWSDKALVFFADAREFRNSGVAFDQYVIGKCSEITGFDFRGGFDTIKNLLLEQNRYFFIIVDNVESVGAVPEFYTAYNLMQTAMIHDRIRFLNACDDLIFYQTDTKFFNRFTILYEWPDFNGLGFNNDEYFKQILQSYFLHHGITTDLTGKARQWCRVPLFLQLFSEVYQNQSMQRVEILKIKYLFDRYIATFSQKILASGTGINQNLDPSIIVKFLERSAFLVFLKRSESILKDHFNSVMKDFSPEILTDLLKLFAKTSLCSVNFEHNSVTINFKAFLIQTYLTSRVLFEQLKWDTYKPDQEITTDLTALIKQYDENPQLPFVLQSLYLFMETIKKDHVFINTLLSVKKNISKYKALLLRCFGWQNEMKVKVWQIIKSIEHDSDRQVVAALKYSKAMIYEQIPDDNTVELLSLPNLSDEKLRSELQNRMRFDSTLSRLVMQFKPYSHLAEIQSGIIGILEKPQEIFAPPLIAGILNFVDLVLGYDLHKGIELMKRWQKFARKDVGILNTWCDIANRNAAAIFPDFWEVFVQTNTNDRPGATRIIQFCIAGGQSAPSTALLLIQKYWHLNTNLALREKVYVFINNFGHFNTDATISILGIAKKENDTRSSPHKLETREIICKASIACFEKKPAAFKPLMVEWLAHDDLKIKQLVHESLKRLMEKNEGK